ncbi:hypothetical protein MHBO_000572 [Bonamia ostreae]|uniref:Uncharacterized protein n=1 Tax=Bonamia ostreae TaxID=126728 RepID=A0ABV2AG17_9EUKA
MRPDHVAKWFSRERLKRHRLLKEDQLQRSSSLDKRADFFLRMQKRRLAAQQRAGALFFGQRRNFQNHPARPGSMFNQNAARHNPWALNHNSMRAQPAQRGFAPFQAANGALEPLEHHFEEPVFRHRFRPAPFPGLSRNPFSAPNFDRRTRGPLLRPYFGYSHFAFGGRGRGKKRRAAPRARFESSLPPPPALPKPRAMVEMIKEAISELNESFSIKW